MLLTPPATLDDGAIHIGTLLGKGAQGAVYAAQRGDEQLAVKVVPSRKAGLRFLGEVRALRYLEHPHVVRLYGQGEEQGWTWIAMELLRGGSAQERLDLDGPFDVQDALAITFDTLCGLAAVHHRGILHRDVKPANLFLDDDGRAVLGDLGVARMPGGSVNYETATGTNLGTLDFAAPEQATDAKRVDVRADLYSMGATLYVLATMRRPSFLYAPTEFPQAYDLLAEPLQPIVRKACAHQPDDRFATAREMAEAVALAREALGDGTASEHMARFDHLSPPPSPAKRLWHRLVDQFAP